MTQPVSFSPLRAIQPVAIAPGAQETPTTSSVSARSTPVSRLAKLANELASQAPPIDHARIALLHQAIASGGYHPDAQAIAEAMLAHFGWTGA